MSTKNFIKQLFVQIGILHPSYDVKLGASAKARVVREYAQKHRLGVLVETGTHTGNMIDALLPHVAQIYSIELDGNLYAAAARRFAGYPNVHLFQGDSAEVLPKVLAELHEPALFWLDAHGSGAINTANAPIAKELEAILAHSVQGHVILIDDARHFGRVSIRSIREQAVAHRYSFAISDGIFILVPHPHAYA